MTRVAAIIPARMGSSRFPGKPLALICGRPMLQHVYARTAECDALDEVIVATCDDDIAAAASLIGAPVAMTSRAHNRATDRVAEAAEVMRRPADVIVMVQGDEPLIRPDMITAAVQALTSNASADCVNLAAAIGSEEELRSPHVIKTAMSRSGRALYFSREAIPTLHGQQFVAGAWLKQVCILAFRRNALRMFASLPESPLEVRESIDMLRFLENDMSVHLALTEVETHAVDTPEDLRRVEQLMSAQAAARGSDRT